MEPLHDVLLWDLNLFQKTFHLFGFWGSHWWQISLGGHRWEEVIEDCGFVPVRVCSCAVRHCQVQDGGVSLELWAGIFVKSFRVLFDLQGKLLLVFSYCSFDFLLGLTSVTGIGTIVFSFWCYSISFVAVIFFPDFGVGFVIHLEGFVSRSFCLRFGTYSGHQWHFHSLVICYVLYVALVMGLIGQEVTVEFEFHDIVAAGSQGCQVWSICYHPFFIGEYQVQGCWYVAVSVVSRAITCWYKKQSR